MTDEEALREIDRQEKRLAAAKCGRGCGWRSRLGSSGIGGVIRERVESYLSISARYGIMCTNQIGQMLNE